MATPQRGVPLPERKTDYVPILYPRVGRPVCCTSISSHVLGVKMHWGERNSTPCIRDYTNCPGCEIRLRKLWYGWLLGIEHHTRKLSLIQLTETAVRANGLLSDSRHDLRGAQVKLTRIADSSGSLVAADVALNTWSDKYKNADPDVWAALLRFYRIELPQFDQADVGEGG